MKNLAFTLAEVLITLVIIGVIAAMTVPTLMNNTNAQEYRSALKKAVSALNQALTLHYALEGETASDMSGNSGANQIVTTIFKTRMSTVDSSAFSVDLGAGTLSIDGASGAGSYAGDCNTTGGNNIFTTADGMKFCVTTDFYTADSDNQDSACNTYNTKPCVNGDTKANMIVDVNGDRKPNAMTTSADRPKDIYPLQIYSQKVVPFGDAAQQVMFDKQVTAG